MWKVFSFFVFLSFINGCCEDEICSDCDQRIDDFIVEQTIELDNFVTVQKNGSVEVNNVKVSDGEEFSLFSIKVNEVRSAVITCNQFGYPDLCKMTGTKGRTLAKDKVGATPEWTDFSMYMEAGSEMVPNDITSTTYYNQATYIHAGDTSANAAALHAAVALWETGSWINARVDFCSIGNPVFCIQE